MHTIKSVIFKVSLIAAITAGNPMCLHAQGISPILADTLQSALENVRMGYNVKGISAAVYMPGRGMWKGVTGVSYDSEPIDTTMLFGIGSITKTFVAAEIFKLVEAGSLSLSDTIGALLPPMSYANPSITVKQLLGHTSGMGDFTNATWQAAMNADLSAMWYFPEALNAFCAPPAAAPGSAFHYCNANYSLLGMIIEAKKGDSLHHVLHNDLIVPYHLDNTHMELFEPYANPIPHNWSTPSLVPSAAIDASATPHQALWSSTEPAGGYFSDPADLAMWAYNLYSGNVLSATSMADMLTFTPVTGAFFNGYGLGAMRLNMSGKTYYGHAGNYFGYASSMLFHTTDSICIGVLINQDCIATYEARDIMNALLKRLSTDVASPEPGNTITLSPNPANTLLTITTPAGNGNIQASMMDVTGKVVYQCNNAGELFSINTQSFDAGVYFIRIVNNSEAVTKQVQIQH